uniref:Density-regulated protein n=1 Tax=Phallusia mammillata TaxID=59560 RepID=A0A6F9DA76_9ASCI|nr:density-regulated protein-like [Phallusia mammillata]
MSDGEASCEVADPQESVPSKETPAISYPVKVLYCPECSLPLEYCEFMPDAVQQRCRAWREKNQDLLSQEGVDIAALNLDDSDSANKKRQKRGGRGNVKAKQKKEPDVVKLARIPRGKRKFVTRVTGLATFDINLKKASKLFAQKFSCGSSVSGDDEIIIQGDVTDDLIDLILETWNEIDEDHIEDLGEVKR